MNIEKQSEILDGLSTKQHIELFTLGISLLDLEQSLIEQAKKDGNVTEFLTYISNLCTSDKSLTDVIIKNIMEEKRVSTRNDIVETEIVGPATKKQVPTRNKIAPRIKAISKLLPNQEQENIVNNCRKGIKVKAFAGTGKSTASRLIIDELGDEKSLYTTFLKQNINDAKSKITNNAFTQDSLACKFALEHAPFKEIFKPGQYSNVYKMKDVVGFDLRFDIGVKKIQQQGVARLINDTISIYSRSCDFEMLDMHVPSQVIIPESRQKILRWAQTYWDYLMSGRATSEHATTFHHLMKFWSLSPSISMDDVYQNIIVDEAQDIDGAFFNVIKNHNDRNLIVIGDAYQQLFKWRGAINSMGLFDKETYSLTTSYRFGSAIADCSNNILSRHSIPPVNLLVGQDNIQSKVSFYDEGKSFPNLPCVILTRTRSQIISIADDELRDGNKIHIKTEMGQLKYIVKNIVNLANGEIDKVTHPYLSKCLNFSMLESELEDTPEPDVYFCMKLYEKYGNSIIDVIERIEKNNTHEREATKIISTTHSIKGQEWENVIIAPDYSYILEKKNVDLDGELSVLYVALTRARKHVYIPSKLKKYFE